MPINASSLLVGTERRRARQTYVATLYAEIPTSIQLTGFAIEVDPSPIWNWPHVRFGSKADICGAKRHVRFTPNSDIGMDELQHLRQIGKASAAWIVHIVRLLLRTVGGDFVEPINQLGVASAFLD